MVTFSFDRKVALLILLAGAISAGLTAAWVPMSALHQDTDAAILPALGQLRITLLAQAPLVLGGEVDVEAFTLEEGVDVVFQLFYNDRLMAESERWFETSFIIEESRSSATGLVLVATNRSPTPVTLHYTAGALRSAFEVERLWLGALLLLPLGAPLAIHQAALRPRRACDYHRSPHSESGTGPIEESVAGAHAGYPPDRFAFYHSVESVDASCKKNSFLIIREERLTRLTRT